MQPGLSAITLGAADRGTGVVTAVAAGRAA
jgi:hypothetical protein